MRTEVTQQVQQQCLVNSQCCPCKALQPHSDKKSSPKCQSWERHLVALVLKRNAFLHFPWREKCQQCKVIIVSPHLQTSAPNSIKYLPLGLDIIPARHSLRSYYAELPKQHSVPQGSTSAAPLEEGEPQPQGVHRGSGLGCRPPGWQLHRLHDRLSGCSESRAAVPMLRYPCPASLLYCEPK